ncbi:MAG: hypothetical protein A3A86_05900 [Elusimicrobia bacterium RIFCSPLOWO2_01_FULL_60_11]|nr:MAG: hypothetical protein A3A86_05900 [Elusimicrobia bacterium RIFCSPLOWO2_01_FULL_60_11]
MPGLKGAIIGLGNVALEGHLPAWKGRKDFRVVAGVDSSKERRELFSKLLPDVGTFENLEECLVRNGRDRSLLDFVDIATPPHTHFALIRAALNAGLHVLCEKPLVLKREDAAELGSLLLRSGKVLMTVHNWKFAPICRKISELIREGAVGDVNRVEWYVLRSGPAVTTLEGKENWRLNPEMSGGGILVDHGWHAFYLVLEWLAGRPSKIFATLEKRQYGDLPVEDTAKARVEFTSPGGVKTVDLFLTWASRLRKNSGLIEGTEGRIHVEDDRLIVVKGSSPARTFPFEKALSAGSHHPDWFDFVIDEFLAEISGASPAGQNFETARACLELIERSKESSAKGGAELAMA